jgi:hypothetical protein
MNWFIELLIALKVLKRGENFPPLSDGADTDAETPPVVTPPDAQAETNTTEITPAIPCGKLPVTATISNVKHGKGKTTWSMTGTAGWPKKTVKKEVQGMTYLYVFRGDTWQGGKFDWFRPGQMVKGHDNIEGGYMKVIPSKGDRVAFGLVDIKQAQRSNFVEGVWP